MAHIVARSPDGPRGNKQLLTQDLDDYENLTLLCPTHHVEVDKCPDAWPVERLRAIKAEHESWVSEQLSSGGIQVAPIDNSLFLSERQNSWIALARSHVAMVLSLTPLRVSADALNPMSPAVVEVVEAARVTSDRRGGDDVNRFRTRPTEHGVANEDFPESVSSYGHSIHVFRVGHCEYFCELGASVDETTKYAHERNVDMRGATRVLRYTDVAGIAEHGLDWLRRAWDLLLPFNYMTFIGAIVNTAGTTLFSREDLWRRGLFGFPVNSPTLAYSEIVSKDAVTEHLLLQLLQRLVHCYGLVLRHVHTESGDYERPGRMR